MGNDWVGIGLGINKYMLSALKFEEQKKKTPKTFVSYLRFSWR
jgi:uncharacterized protein (DUF2225 family)